MLWVMLVCRAGAGGNRLYWEQASYTRLQARFRDGTGTGIKTQALVVENRANSPQLGPLKHAGKPRKRESDPLSADKPTSRPSLLTSRQADPPFHVPTSSPYGVQRLYLYVSLIGIEQETAKSDVMNDATNFKFQASSFIISFKAGQELWTHTGIHMIPRSVHLCTFL